VLPRHWADRDKIGTVTTDTLSHIGESPCDPRIDVLRLRIDEAHRDTRNHMLERRAPPQVNRPCPQLQPEIH